METDSRDTKNRMTGVRREEVQGWVRLVKRLNKDLWTQTTVNTQYTGDALYNCMAKPI